jgi:photosynthetic reaction center cytochrome c subunit
VSFQKSIGSLHLLKEKPLTAKTAKGGHLVAGSVALIYTAQFSSRWKSMPGQLRVFALSTAAVGALSISSIGIPLALAQAKVNQSAAATPKTTEQVFKNIKVLKGTPADQLIPAMQFAAASLGVECDFCHVPGHFDQDDKKPKATARKMMTMMFAINKDNFEGEREVTCFSCHRGAVKPVATPLVAEEGFMPAMPRTERSKPASGEEEKLDLSKLPAPDELIAKYVRALGGEDAIRKLSSRVAKGTASGFGGKFPVEALTKIPDASLTTIHLPNGDSVTVYDGHEGWMVFPGHPARSMEGADLEAARMDSDLHFPIDMAAMFAEFKKASKEKVQGQSAFQVLAIKKGQPPVKLYFDENTGLLLRLVRYAESPLGLYPTQIDYADYREQDGVKVPFRLTTARPGGTSTTQFEEIRQNIPIDETRFAKPATSPTTAK